MISAIAGSLQPQTQPLILTPTRLKDNFEKNKINLEIFKNLKEGERIGYGGRIKTNRPTNLAIIYCGYADGFPQTALDGTLVRVNNSMAPVLGRVSMDLLSVDVTEISHCSIGDWCEFWSLDLPITKNAETNNLISYELMTKLNPRVKKQYLNV